MTITYSDDKKAEWAYFKKNGGNISFEIDASDITTTKDFERNLSIQPSLKTGFELPPTSLIESPELQALIQVHGSAWDYIRCLIYLNSGKIIYKQLENGKYEAICTVPAV